MNSPAQPRRNRVKQTLYGVLLCACANLLAGVVHASEFEFGGAGKGGDSWLEEEAEFLKVDEAFVLSAMLDDDGALNARWDMPDGYYLYRHQFAFETKNPEQLSFGEAQIPPGKTKIDDYFGEVEVYYHNA